MAATHQRWTLDELHRLPDDGNRYEVIRGELFVTPPPACEHEAILVRLQRRLAPYVDDQRIGNIFHPRAVLRFDGSEAEPDLFVRPGRLAAVASWDDAPAPLLVVEVLSDTTRTRDLVHKRGFYLRAGVADYWVIDAGTRTVRVVRRGEQDVVEESTVRWHPAGATRPLELAVPSLFDDES
jgi:Uma2 family endonuclease